MTCLCCRHVAGGMTCLCWHHAAMQTVDAVSIYCVSSAHERVFDVIVPRRVSCRYSSLLSNVRHRLNTGTLWVLKVCYASLRPELLVKALFSNCAFVALASITERVSTVFWNWLTDFDANWHKWSTEQGGETIHFWGQEVKVHGHRRPKIALPAWRRHRSRLCCCSSC